MASTKTSQLPEIRTSETHRVPACVTIDRLMRYLTGRNRTLDPRYRDIAQLYKSHGEMLGIRWDYAFFQMLLETNFLTFRRGNGERGDVKPQQNNFAGIGATGGGMPGDSFSDVATGVLAHMQHLLAYSGQRVDRPVARRTRDRQDDIISKSHALRRAVRFSDLTNRWAADRAYARSIEVIATRFREEYCLPERTPMSVVNDGAGRSWPGQMALASPKPGVPLAGRPAQSGAERGTGVPCDIWAASYGGPVALLIRSIAGSTVNYTVLQVEKDLEHPQAQLFMETYAHNGVLVARFDSREQALARAFELCPRATLVP